MNYMENNSVRRSDKKLKGFSLIELIIVMAIIGILAMMASLVIPGFVNNARVETNCQKAQMIYEACQTYLIECEINQDISLLDALDPGDPSAAIVTFHIAGKGNGATYETVRLGNIVEVQSYFESTSNTKWLNRGDEEYTAFEKAIIGKIDSKMEGTVAVFFDLENYTVDSVLYRELEGGEDPTIAWTNLTPYQHNTTDAYVYYGADNIMEVKEVLKDTGIYYGAYPFQDDVT